MDRRRHFAIVICLSVSLGFSGCAGSDDHVSSEINSFTYENITDSERIACDGDTLYTLSYGEHSGVVTAYSPDGNVISSVNCGELSAYQISYMCVNSGVAYLAVSAAVSEIYSLDLSTGSCSCIAVLNDIDAIEKIGISQDRIYWLGTNSRNARNIAPFVNDNGTVFYCENRGETMGWCSISGNETGTLSFDFPMSFAVSDNAVEVYAFDEQNGYFFADAQTPDNREYTDKLGNITSFEYTGSNDEITFTGSSAYLGALPITKPDSASGIIRASGDVNTFFASDICAANGCVYVLTADSKLSAEKKVKRFDVKDIKISGDPVKIISSRYFEELPHSAGAEVRYDQLNPEGFALTVLSLDTKYDLAAISSDQDFADNIRKKGSFYPLNDVPGVKEYIQACFPYIQEAVEKDGEIWCLPISNDIPVLVYNEKNCSEKGLNFGGCEGLLKSVSDAGGNYDCARWTAVNYYFRQYLSKHDSFKTDEFHDMAAILKQFTPERFVADPELYSALLTVQAFSDDPYYSRIYDKFLFSLISDHSQQADEIAEDDNLRAASLSESGEINGAVCTFLCVNPYSEHLEETLAYISGMAQTLSNSRNSFMLSDKGSYSDGEYIKSLLSIYQNAEISFGIPSEIYYDDFEKYSADEITLDEFITESDRKLSAYLNE